MGPLQNAGMFIIHSIFDLFSIILLLRLISQYLRVDYYNPLSQFIVKATNPVVVPLRRFIPGYWGIDMATVAALVVFTFIKIILMTLIGAQKFPAIVGLLLWSVGDIFTLTIKLFFWSILIQVISSWMAPTSRSPVTFMLYQLTEPLMRPARRLIPTMGGMDISPIPVLIILELLIILLADPLTRAGFQFAIR